MEDPRDEGRATVDDGTPGTRRGPAAVDAAIEEFEIRSRLDEADPGVRQPADYDLSWASGRIDAARRAAEADVITADEALAWLAREVGRDLPDEVEVDDAEDVERRTG